MSFEPQKFFIGLMDFFSILLPGALLTYLVMGRVGPLIIGERYALTAGAQAWAAFLVASYVLGHLLFLLGAWLDELYDWIRHYTLNTQIALLARRNQLLFWPVRALIWLVFKRERNLAVDKTTSIRHQALDKLRARDTINTFQWCKALLGAENSASLAAVQRLEADSKFFRCFAVVLLILLVAWPWQDGWPWAGVPIVLALLLLLSLWRYMELRYKATNQAYWSVITLTAREGKVVFDGAGRAVASPTHAGGVVFRKRWWGRAKYLLIEANDDPAQWVLPKGQVEEGEQHRETAVREVHEETGVWARIDLELNDVSYTVNGTVVTTRFFLMRAVGQGLRKDRDRRHVWLALPQALARASYSEARSLLEAAETQRLLN